MLYHVTLVSISSFVSWVIYSHISSFHAEIQKSKTLSVMNKMPKVFLSFSAMKIDETRLEYLYTESYLINDHVVYV